MLTAHLPKQQAQSLQFCQLEVTFRCIKVINNVPATVRFISRLNLTGNHLISLNGIQQFHNLETLIFDYNHIALPSELNKINNPFFIKELSYFANPLYYHTAITTQQLRSQGFTHIQKLNQFHKMHASPSKPAIRLKIPPNQRKSANHLLAETDFTARRRPNYRPSPEGHKTNRKIIGKIYYNPKFMTNQREREKEGPPNNTRESTLKQSLEASAPFEAKSSSPLEEEQARQSREVKPFEHLAESAETAKFSEMSELQRLGEQFLNEEKQLLACRYHERCLLERYFTSWKNKRAKTIEDELEPHRGQLINNTLETLHFSLIKLRHDFIQRTS